MSELTLPISAHSSVVRSSYAGSRRRSPSALAAALALNGGAFALILLMPATQYIIDQVDTIRATNIPIKQDPPETKPVQPKEQNKTQTTIPTPRPDDVYVLPPITPITGTGPAIGGAIQDPGPITPTLPVDPPLAPHKAVFVKAMQDPRYASAFHPDYPPALRRAGLEGSVTVRVTIDAGGRVTAVELVKATNPAFFDETREQALRYWRFKPATSDGAAVESQQTLTVQFHLEDE